MPQGKHCNVWPCCCPVLQDKEGYTPLHMAAGYMHTAAMAVLLEGGADPQIKDNSGKDVVSLIENIRNNMPLSLGTVMQRMRLETVCNTLTGALQLVHCLGRSHAPSESAVAQLQAHRL